MPIPDPRYDKVRARWRWTAEKMAWKQAELDTRGYTIKWGYVGIAYAGEILIIAASLAGAWILATMYGDGSWGQFLIMMLAPITYAAIELTRVPLAIVARTQRSFLIKLIALIGIVLAAAVTTKSLAQLGEMMFHPRLIETARARERVNDAKTALEGINQRITDADARVAEESAALQAIDKRAMETVTALGALGGPKCMEVSGTTRNGGKYKTMRCAPDNRGEVITGALRGTNSERPEAERKLAAARAERAKLDRGVLERNLSAAETAHHEAVMRSQLHSFTAMVHAVEPTAVTDGQVHGFLRIFVFLPAVCAAFASTLLAFCSVQFPKRNRGNASASASTLDFPLAGVDQLLVPLVGAVEARMTERMRVGFPAAHIPPVANEPAPAPALQPVPSAPHLAVASTRG